MKRKKIVNTLGGLGGLLTILGLTLFNEHKKLQLFILIAGVLVTAVGVLMIEKSRKRK